MTKPLNIPLPEKPLEVEPAYADGKPHFTYFNYDYDISFVWSGNFADKIQICPNGYGEPCMWELQVEEEAWIKHFEFSGQADSEEGATPAWWLDTFAWFCERFIEGAAAMTKEQFDLSEEGEGPVFIKELGPYEFVEKPE